MFKLLVWQKYVLAFTSIMLLGLVGSYDIEQAEKSHALYCENVASGVWPAYDKEIKCK